MREKRDRVVPNHDEEAAAASAEPSTFGHFPPFKRVQSTMYNNRAKRYRKLPSHRQDLQIPALFRTTKVGDDFLLWQSASRDTNVDNAENFDDHRNRLNTNFFSLKI
ncbi:nucleolar MIF4G domain-containing protein 1 [Trichinella spiralis]|uniref:nucleolar MIF4G domain-containing protein 1 n=1 Tax=Trichinella spiralis TaxID=6334 RepID=UPI0001EFC072|nr:nucleolar MIF4G domain-containing protein 1 [Trichinella spiralis]